MRHLQVSIPDSFYNSFMEFLKQIPEVKIKEDADDYISESVKNMVRERLRNSKKEDFIPWEEVRKMLKYKAK